MVGKAINNLVAYGRNRFGPISRFKNITFSTEWGKDTKNTLRIRICTTGPWLSVAMEKYICNKFTASPFQ
jgi:hypothetical protein